MGVSRRLLVWVLSAILAVGLPLFAPYALSAEEPCSMSHHEESATDGITACAQSCAAVCAGMVLPALQRLRSAFHTERLPVISTSLFQSHAGPPGLQPPR